MKYLFTLITLLFVGCGDATESDYDSTPRTSNSIDMVINKSYSVSQGDHIENASSDAQVKVVKDIEGDATSVTLLAGSAQLIRDN